MKVYKQIYKLFIVLLLLQYLACTSNSYFHDPVKYKQKITELINRIRADPNDVDAMQEIGIIFVKKQRYDAGRKVLARVYKLKPEGPKTSFYYGFSLESTGREKQAFNVYRTYEEMSSNSRYSRLMKGRYNYLRNKIIRQEARALLAQEEQLQTQPLKPKTIAVLPFHYVGVNDEYKSIGKGISEMIITDLSQIEGLRLVERIRLQAIMDEINLASTGLVDAKTAPKCGHLLSAGQVIYGAYDIFGNDRFDVDVEFYDLIKSESPLKASASDALNNIFHFEKRIVFSVISKMRIELTQQEKERILRIPTKNMQAFINFCKGLEHQDAGQFGAAAASFEKALNMDPSFKSAENRAQESQSVSEVSGETESVLASVDRIESGTEFLPTTDNLVNRRLQNLSENIGSHFLPGQESREVSEEASGAGVDVGLSDLPRPPNPPGTK